LGASSYEFAQQRYEVESGEHSEFEKEETCLINIMYNIRDYWVFGLCPSFVEHNVLETGTLSVLR
jgi:hypothetical protein